MSSNRELLLCYTISFTLSDLQFGYKSNSSTTMCTSMLLETINHYTSTKSEIYVVFIDASKAFDRVSHDKLFSLLLHRAVCPSIVRLLFIMYCNSSMSVRWGEAISSMFSVQNGVRQGGVLSPVLYNIYTDNLLLQLKKSGLGCYIKHTFSGALGYADDLVLLSPSLYGMRAMVSICERYAHDFKILFNPNKSKLLCCNVKDTNMIKMTLCGKPVEIVDSMQYLGNYVSRDTCDRNIESVIQDFWYKHNCMRANFNMLNSYTLNKLHSTYCMNIYGSELFNYNSKYVNKLYVAWRKDNYLILITELIIVLYLVSLETRLHRQLARFT